MPHLAWSSEALEASQEPLRSRVGGFPAPGRDLLGINSGGSDGDSGAGSYRVTGAMVWLQASGSWDQEALNRTGADSRPLRAVGYRIW
jgi:hypothetical protein